MQYLRALAASAVVVFHATTRAGRSQPIGEAGVDLFFVLSGFLMVVITSARTRPAAFLADRVRRIVPTYWIATSVMLAGAVAGAFPNVRLTAGHVLASYGFIPWRSPSNAMPWPLLVQGWTLNLEMFFYVAFALVLAVSARRWQLPMLTALLGMLAAFGWLVRPDGVIARTYTDPMLIEFVAGGWLGMMWKQRGAPAPRWAAPLFAAAIALFVAAWAAGGDGDRVIRFGLPAGLLVVATLTLEHRPGGIRRYAPAVLIGDASYSVYLWHTFGISTVHAVCRPLGVPAAAEIALSCVGGIGIGVIAYLAIERPLLIVLRRRRSRHAVTIAAGP